MVERKRTGARRVELVAPFDAGCNRIIDAIEMRPVTLDHVLRWQAGLIGDPFALLAELSGLTADILGQLMYPDADIVMGEFALHCPPAIRNTLGQTAIVPSADAPAVREPQPPPHEDDPDTPPDLADEGVDSKMFEVS